MSADDAWDLTIDFVTSDLGRILASVCYGDISPIQRLIEDENVEELVRAASLDSLLILVASDKKLREEIILYFKELLQGKLQTKNSFVRNQLIECCINLYPGEIVNDIKEFFKENSSDGDYIRFEQVEEAIEAGQEKVLTRLRNDELFSLITDASEDIESLESEVGKDPNKIPELLKQLSNARKGEFDTLQCPCGSGKKYKKCCGKKSKIQ